MDSIIEQIKGWNYVREIPASFAGFSLVTELMQCDTQYRIFTYHNAASYRSFTVLYDQATKDFLARVVIGLTEFCDVNFICGSLEQLEKLLKERMFSTLDGLAAFNPDLLCSVIREKKVANWPYAVNLPTEIAGFSLYIDPAKPVKVLNGSYIILDYSNFPAESSLMIYYNIYRDEFFGELKIKRTPQMINCFDCRQLNDLEEKIKEHLEPTLQNMRSRVI